MTENLRHSEKRCAPPTSSCRCWSQSSPLAIYTRDANGLLTSWNPAAEKMYGWKAPRCWANPALGAGGGARRVRRLRMRLLTGEPFIKHEARRIRRDGRPIEIDASIGPLLT